MTDQHAGRGERLLNALGFDGQRLTGARWLCDECGDWMKKEGEPVDIGYSMAVWRCQGVGCTHQEWVEPEVRVR